MEVIYFILEAQQTTKYLKIDSIYEPNYYLEKFDISIS